MNCCRKDEEVENLTVRKIPRPPNAFMLFANANRKIMAQRYPTESNKDISKRLGCSWKSLEVTEKNKYFDKAKIIDNEHKKKYPNYVYNPKEARIRKAMREANRDRSIGNSPMLPRLGERHSSHAEWTQPQEDPLMMSPMNEMRRMDTSVCGYPMPSPESHFIPPIDVYNKMNSAPSMVPNYMQPSPLAQLQQQQTEMWHPYQKNMPPRPLGTPFHRPMMQQQPPPFMTQESVQESPTNLIMDKSRESPGCRPQPPSVPSGDLMEPPIQCCNTPERPKSVQPTNQQHFMENARIMECMQTAMMEGKLMQSQNEQYMPSSEPVVNKKSFETAPKSEGTVVTKKPRGRPPTKKVAAPPPPPPPKPLPDFNEAFGSTERGRFLSPPDPRLTKSYFDMSSVITPPKTEDDKQNGTFMSCFCPPANFFTEEYRMDYIAKHFAALPEYSLTNINTVDGVSFPYASLSPRGYKSVETFLEVSAVTEEPLLISTDYGYIPVLEIDSLN